MHVDPDVDKNIVGLLSEPENVTQSIALPQGLSERGPA